MRSKETEGGVSPVIGTMLMLAVTVILAAVIAAFVFGMAGAVQKQKSVAVTVSKPDGSHIYVTYAGGQDAPLCNAVNVTVTSGSGNPVTYNPSLNGLGYMNSGGDVLVVGTEVVATSSMGFAGKNNRVVAVGNFNEGTQQVLLDTYV
ncbi:MAG: type IV pilin N-terminal domain-containing protein [Methanoregula sp.]|jgi:flagellin-like protein|uniref:type IV pilin N-terminal domain-containing protein n=1 Tax=Methanoregula sp. TaxID=2052170 RepID=UPI003C18F208